MWWLQTILVEIVNHLETVEIIWSIFIWAETYYHAPYTDYFCLVSTQLCWEHHTELRRGIGNTFLDTRQGLSVWQEDDPWLCGENFTKILNMTGSFFLLDNSLKSRVQTKSKDRGSCRYLASIIQIRIQGVDNWVWVPFEVHINKISAINRIMHQDNRTFLHSSQVFSFSLPLEEKTRQPTVVVKRTSLECHPKFH